MTTKQELIQNIEGLYPADSDYPSTAQHGQELLLKAIFQNWRELPINILEDYSQLCTEREFSQFNQFMRERT